MSAPKDLMSVVCVKSKRLNDRITFQSGAFFLFGQDAQIYEGKDADDKIVIERLLVPKRNKKRILKELNQLNINASTLFPNIETSAEYVKNQIHHKKL